MKKRTIKPLRDDIEKENVALIKQRLKDERKRLKEEQDEKDFAAMDLLKDKVCQAIDDALYGDTELNHADILDVIVEALGQAGIDIYHR